MSKRYSELDNEEQASINSAIEVATYSRPVTQDKTYQQFGLCADCAHIAVAETEFSVVFAFCKAFEGMVIKLNETKPILECTDYTQRNQPSLWDMQQIAVIIEPHNKIGFD